MKRVICVLLLITAVFSFSSCFGKLKYVPDGYIESGEYFDKAGFQDFTDFCYYKYNSADCFKENKAYTKIGESDIENVKGYFEHFGSVMEYENRMDEYVFDINSVSSGDYVRIETKEGKPIGDLKYEKYDNYSIYFFDVETLTLYYIHTNI